MGIESKEIQQLADDSDDAEALFGSRRRNNGKLYPDETVFRVFVGCMEDASDKLMYESLLTKSFQTNNDLRRPGDLALLEVQGTFDRDGCYRVYARYAIIPEVVEDKGGKK